MALLQRLIFWVIIIVLSGCGGSGDGGLSRTETPDENVDTSETISILLSISDTKVVHAMPVTLTATVMEGSTPLSGKLVTFSIDDETLAIFDTDISTSSTDADGNASIMLLAGSSSGSGIITASVDSIDSTPIAFDSAGDGGVIGGPIASGISLFASSQQIASSGIDEVILTSIAKDNNNNLVEGVTVTFSASSGQIEIVNSITGADGQATAILKTNNEPTNRVITITSQNGQVMDTVDVHVTGTTINLTGSSTLAINDENTFFIQVINSEGEGIPNVVVDISLSDTAIGAVADINIVDTVTTDITGQATFSVLGTSGGGNSIIIKAVGVVESHDVTVQADSFLFSTFNNGQQSVNPEINILPDVLLSNTATIELTWLQSNVPIADGTVVSFTSTRGTLTANSATILNGKASTSISSTNAGKALITVTGSEGGTTLNNQLEFEFVAETIHTLVAQASPSSIAPNGDTSTISVVAKDINGNLVKGKTIEFTLTDTNGGNILPATAVTDSNGSASTVYTSNTSSAQNGVSIKATVQEFPTLFNIVELTVAERELFISLGTGNELIEPDITTYNKQYSAFVTDVDSTPREGVVLTVSAIPSDYYKGTWMKILDENGDFLSWAPSYSTIPPCPNEDVNKDGILDVGEDINSNGRLTPGNIVSALGEVTTDEFGQAIIDIRYAQSFGNWVDVNLIVSTKVNGTENSSQTRFTLPVLASDVLVENTTPPTSGIGLSGPFGLIGDCSNEN